MRAISRAAAAVGFAVTMLPGCTVTPQQDGLARVPVDLVVARIKCELAHAILDKAKTPGPGGRMPFAFLNDWAAKLHFTVIVDDQGSVNPGATFIHTLPASGTVAQKFTLGAGVGFTAQAVRQEDYEYLMSFKDLRAESKASIGYYCSAPEGMFLESNLGLKALVDSALKPIEQDILYPGRNYGPGALPPVGTNLQPLNAKDQLAQFEKAKSRGRENGIFSFNVIRDFEDNNDQLAKDIEVRAQAIINNIVKPLSTIATTTGLKQNCVDGLNFLQEEATVASVNLSADVLKVYAEKTDKETKANTVKKDFEGLVKFANDLIRHYKECALAKPPPGTPKLYDPIDAISETVNFYVTTTGSLTPTWTLVQVTAPLAPTFLSATRKDTNTVIISLGRPILTADGTPMASNAMNNQILASLLSQAVAQRPNF